MINFKDILKLKSCPNCGSDWIEEIYDVENFLYHIKCKSCSHLGEGSMVQEEASYLWNNDEKFVSEIRELEEELDWFMGELDALEQEIESLEDQRIDIENEIFKIKNKIKKLK